jgi:Flp pilus assembly protein TadG
MKQQRESQSPFKTFLRDECGAVAVMVTVTLPVMVGFMTLAVDATNIYMVKDQLQNAADAAALAGTQWVGYDTDTGGTGSTPCASASASQLAGKYQFCAYAKTLASDNMPTSKYGTVLQYADIVAGVWSSAGAFTPLGSAASGTTPNAVQVTTRMTTANGNPVTTFFTPMLAVIARGAGFSSFSLTATATAAFTSTNAGAGGSGVNATSDLIIVQDISGSFSGTIANAQTAETECAKDFAQSGGANSKFGVVLFTGNSPQAAVTTNSPTAPAGGWGPQGWTPTLSPSLPTETAPYQALTSATSSNFLTNTETNINNIQDCSGGAYPYTCSGSNIAAGMQAAINQFCPASGCLGGTLQMVIITDGISNCTTVSTPVRVANPANSTQFGTSTIAGQNCPAGSGGSGMSSGDGQLLTDAQNLATAAGNLGITVSTLYYSGESGEQGGSAKGPDGQTHAQELENLTILANTALKNKLGANAVQGQFFNQPTSSSLKVDMQQACVGGANANKPRLVL